MNASLLPGWKSRVRAAGVHLILCLVIALVTAAIVFWLWYPYPYRESSGGRELFLIVIAVDAVLGPLITFTVFNVGKTRVALIRDLAVVGILQLTALSYGLWAVYVARPVHLMFEYDRFSVVHAIDIPEELLDQAPKEFRELPLTGPTMLSIRPFKTDAEKMEATLMALQGLALGARPDLWRSYERARTEVLAQAKPIASLKEKLPQRSGEIDAAILRSGKAEDALRYLPMTERKSIWTVLLDAETAEVRGFIPLDSF